MPSSGDPTAADRARLGAALLARRLSLSLSQEDLIRHGGPSHQTVRQLERGGDEYIPRPSTFVKLDRALRWPLGTTERILRGEATDADLSAYRDEVTTHREPRHLSAVVAALPAQDHPAPVPVDPRDLDQLDDLDGPDDDVPAVASLVARLSVRRHRSPAETEALAALCAWLHELTGSARLPF